MSGVIRQLRNRLRKSAHRNNAFSSFFHKQIRFFPFIKV